MTNSRFPAKLDLTVCTVPSCDEPRAGKVGSTLCKRHRSLYQKVGAKGFPDAIAAEVAAAAPVKKGRAVRKSKHVDAGALPRPPQAAAPVEPAETPVDVAPLPESPIVAELPAALNGRLCSTCHQVRPAGLFAPSGLETIGILNFACRVCDGSYVDPLAVMTALERQMMDDRAMLEQQLRATTTANDQLRSDVADLAGLEQECARLRAEVDALARQPAPADNAELVAERDLLRVGNGALKSTNAALEAQIVELKDQVTRAGVTAEALRAECETLDQQLQAARAELRRLIDSADEHASIRDLRQQHRDAEKKLEDQIRELMNTLAGVRKQYDALKAKYDLAADELAHAHAELKRLRSAPAKAVDWSKIDRATPVTVEYVPLVASGRVRWVVEASGHELTRNISNSQGDAERAFERWCKENGFVAAPAEVEVTA